MQGRTDILLVLSEQLVLLPLPLYLLGHFPHLRAVHLKSFEVEKPDAGARVDVLVHVAGHEAGLLSR